jgi:prephenate dehydrogenase
MDEPDFTLSTARVAIVGLGLMGGSLALALRGCCREIVGVDADPAALRFALDHSIIGRAADFDAALDCDFVILAAPVRAILSQLDHLSHVTRHSSRVTLLDLGSTKSQIIATMQSLPAHFDPLGGHPMCGKEVSGIAHAEAGLYRGKVFVLTPLERTPPRALALAHELIETIGARPLVLSPERHDALAAVSSHLPYVVAVALMRAAQSLDDDQLWALAASGFRDTSRLAASDVTMMTDTLLTNRAAILDALTGYRRELDSLIALIDAADPAALRAALAPAQSHRSELFR